MAGDRWGELKMQRRAEAVLGIKLDDDPEEPEAAHGYSMSSYKYLIVRMPVYIYTVTHIMRCHRIIE